MNWHLDSIYNRAAELTGKSREQLEQTALLVFGSILMCAMERPGQTIWTQMSMSEGKLDIEVDVNFRRAAVFKQRSHSKHRPGPRPRAETGQGAAGAFTPKAASAESVAAAGPNDRKADHLCAGQTRKLRRIPHPAGQAGSESRSGTGTSVVQGARPAADRKQPQAERACRRCGCTESTPCTDARLMDACSWVELDLCSACLTKPEFKRFLAGQRKPSLKK